LLAARLAIASRHQSALRNHAAAALRQRLMMQLRAPLPQWSRLVGARDAFLRRVSADQHQRGARIEALERNLAHLNPQAVLERGYAIVTADDGSIVQDSAQIAPGDAVGISFARGGANATITSVKRPASGV
jgi:exodeoxyribonuclease VII large subunit